MEITLNDGRKAEVLGMISEKLCRIRLEDGREVPWPNDKIKYQDQEGEETLKVVQVPAIDRYEEVHRYHRAIREADHYFKLGDRASVVYGLMTMEQQLIQEVIEEAKEKWGLTSS